MLCSVLIDLRLLYKGKYIFFLLPCGTTEVRGSGIKGIWE